LHFHRPEACPSSQKALSFCADRSRVCIRRVELLLYNREIISDEKQKVRHTIGLCANSMTLFPRFSRQIEEPFFPMTCPAPTTAQ
jgi:hypothetical protein